MSGTILIGVDVESCGPCTANYARLGVGFLERCGVRGTWYVTGRAMEREAKAFVAADRSGVVDVQAHTYDHVLLKSILLRVPKGLEIHGSKDFFFRRGGNIEEIDRDLARCQRVYHDTLGRLARGLTGPWAYYRGLGDRPDLLEIVHSHGFQFLRTYGRNEHDGQPVEMEIQPYFYAYQGFGRMLELPIQGYQDDFYYAAFNGLPDASTYAEHLRTLADRVAKEDLVWSLCTHDHGCQTPESFAAKTAWLAEIIAYAKGLGIRFLTGSEYYAERIAAMA